MDLIDIRRAANVSTCGQYRYSLDRKWFPDQFYSPARILTHPMPLIFVMLNPSTADAYSDDPTIRRCVGFAKREGFQWLRVINLYGGRATKPSELFQMDDPIGPDNACEWELARQFYDAGAEIVCGWGAEPRAQARAALFTDFMKQAGVRLRCLGVTKTGAPKHPLYLPGDAELSPWPAQGMAARSDETGTGSAGTATARPDRVRPNQSTPQGDKR